jgi:hypothetical protein
MIILLEIDKKKIVVLIGDNIKRKKVLTIISIYKIKVTTLKDQTIQKIITKAKLISCIDNSSNKITNMRQKDKNKSILMAFKTY